MRCTPASFCAPHLSVARVCPLCRTLRHRPQRKHALLTESVPDAAAAAEHLEMLLDGHCAGKLPLEDSTLRTLASKLWARGCERYAQGDLHHTCEDFERAFRCLEPTSSLPAKSRVQATLAHCYLQQDRHEQAVDRANHCLKILREHGDPRAASSALSTGSSGLRGGALCSLRGCSDADEDDLCSARSLAQITIIKARVKQGDTVAAHAQVESLLAQHHDPLLLASVCEELANGGRAYHSASILILERTVEQIAELPLASSETGPTACPTAGPSPQVGPPSAMPAASAHRSSVVISSERLASSTRSLVSMRLQAAEAADSRLDSTRCPGISASSPAHLEMRAPLLADLQRIAFRVGRDGSAVYDDPAHIEWLAETAWHLAYLEAQRNPSGPSAAARQATPPRAGAQRDEAGGSGEHTMTDADDEAADARQTGSGEASAVALPEPGCGAMAASADRSAAAIREALQAIAFCADFTEASVELTASLPPTEARLHEMLRGRAVMCRCALRISVILPTIAAAEGESEADSGDGGGGEQSVNAAVRAQLECASKSLSAAFKLHQRCSLASGSASQSGGGSTDSVLSTLQLLSFEVALRRRDPNAREVLRRAADAEGVTAGRLRVLADLAFECHERELGVAALEQCLTNLLAGEPRRHSELAAVLRELIRRAQSRTAAQPHFRTAMRLLDGCSDANAPLSTDDLQWLLAESWNKGVAAMREGRYDEAETWMSQAFSFSNFSPALHSWREQLNEGYSVCLQMLNEETRHSSRTECWTQRLSKRINESDEDMGKRRKLFANGS